MNRIQRYCLLLGFALLLFGCDPELTDAQHLTRAQEYIEADKVKAATIELKNALQKNPNNPVARFLLGKVHLESGNPAGAEKELTRAKKLGVGDKEILPLLSQAYLQQGKSEEVLALPEEDLAADEQAEVLANKGLVKLAKGEIDEAESLIEKAFAADPKSIPVLMAAARLYSVKKEFEQARERVDRVLKADPEHLPAWSLLGDIERYERAPEQAEKAYTKAIELGDNNLTARLKRAMVLIPQKKYDEAQSDIALLIEQAPQHPGVNYAQGLIHYQNKKYKEANSSFDLALADEKRYPQALFLSGVTNHYLGNTEQAELHTEKFLTRFPKSNQARKLLGLIALRKRDYAKVEKLIRPLQDDAKDDPFMLNLLATALMKLGKTDEGIELLKRVAELDPDSTAAQMRLGAGLLQSGEHESGVAQIESVIKMDPKNQQADIILVLNYLRQKQPEKALKAAEAYLERHPESSTAYNLLGQAYLGLEQEAKAEEAFTKARELTPGDPSANQSLADLAMKKKDTTKARALYQEVLEKHENYLPTLLRLAALDAFENKADAMVEHLQQAMTAHPKALQPRLLLARYHLAKGNPERVAFLMNGLEDAQKRHPEVLRLTAMSQLAQNKFDAAKLTLTQLIELQPKSGQAHHLMARAYAGKQDPKRMRSELEKAVELEPNYFPARFALAQVTLQAREKAATETHVKVLKTLAPEQPDVLMLEASLASLNGDTEKALALSEKAFSLSPTSKYMTMLARRHLQAGDQNGAKDLLEKWSTEHPDDISAHLLLASAYLQEKQMDAVIEQYQKVLELDEKNLVALNNLAWHLQDTQPKQAVVYARRATELNSTSYALMDTLALALMKNGETAESQRAIKKALLMRPDDLTLQYHSAMIDAAAGSKETALKQLETLLSKGEKFPEKEEAEKLLDQLRTSG